LQLYTASPNIDNGGKGYKGYKGKKGEDHYTNAVDAAARFFRNLGGSSKGGKRQWYHVTFYIDDVVVCCENDSLSC